MTSVVVNAFGGRYYEPGPGRTLHVGLTIGWPRGALMATRRRARRIAPFTAVATLCPLLATATLHVPLHAQEETDVRFGITMGGTSFLGISLEFVASGHALELSAGTWSLRDLSLSVVLKEYLGVSAMKPVLGAGLWAIISWPRPGERSGAAVVARFPIGFDWNAGGNHYIDFEMNVNRGLWIRRGDPTDTTPLNRRLVPLPGVSYRFGL